MKIPKITTLIDRACTLAECRKGYDINAAEGRAFIKQLFILIGQMNPREREIFLDHYIDYYRKQAEKEGRA